MSDAHHADQLDHFLSTMLDGCLTEDEQRKFDRLLFRSLEARHAYLDWVDVHTVLRKQLGPAESIERPGVQEESDVVTPAESRSRRIYQQVRDFANHYTTLSLIVSGLFLAILLLSMALIVPEWKRIVPGIAGPDTTFVATITDTRDASWDDSSDGNFKNLELFAGERLVLNRGWAEIQQGDHCRVILEGPAAYVIKSTLSGQLEVGKLVARVEDQQASFVVETPTAKVIDLGTEFGVNVKSSKDMDVLVLEGSVQVQTKTSGGAQPTPQTLTAGESLQISSQGRILGKATVSERDFVRGWEHTAVESFARLALRAKPIAYWRFDETALGSIPDASGNGHSATIGGELPLQPAPRGLGNAARFGAGYATVVDQNALRITGPLTIECWLRHDGMPTNWERVAEKNFEQGYVLCIGPITAATAKLTPGHAVFGLNGQFAESAVPVNDGEWHHVVATWNGQQMQVYVDGQPGKPVPFAGPIGTSSHPLAIGTLSGNASSTRFAGSLAALAIYADALPRKTIAKHYEVAP